MTGLSIMKQVSVVLFGILLTACASQPLFDRSGVDDGLKPDTAQDQLDQVVLWGGTIIDSQNLSDRTRLEVLAYPLRHDFQPDVNAATEGRFIVEQAGYLETREYAPGREISVKGRLQSSRSGRIGNSEYRYAVVEAEQIKLWPVEKNRGRFSFGIGVSIIR